MGPIGWSSVMDGLDGLMHLETLGQVECPGLLMGTLKILLVGGGYEKPCHKEEGMAISFLRYLPRSANYLTELDIRYSQPFYLRHSTCTVSYLSNI
jgi:hypothetical protein